MLACSAFITPIRALKANKKNSVSPSPDDDLAMQSVGKIYSRLHALKNELNQSQPTKSPEQLAGIKFEVYQLNEKYEEIKKMAEFLKFCEQNLLAEGGEKYASKVTEVMAKLETYLEDFSKSDNVSEFIAEDHSHYYESMLNQVTDNKPASVILRDIEREYTSGKAEETKANKTYGVNETSQYWKKQKAINDKEGMDLVAMEKEGLDLVAMKKEGLAELIKQPKALPLWRRALLNLQDRLQDIPLIGRFIKKTRVSDKFDPDASSKMGEAGSTNAKQQVRELLNDYERSIATAKKKDIPVSAELETKLNNLKVQFDRARSAHPNPGSTITSGYDSGADGVRSLTVPARETRELPSKTNKPT